MVRDLEVIFSETRPRNKSSPVVIRSNSPLPKAWRPENANPLVKLEYTLQLPIVM